MEVTITLTQYFLKLLFSREKFVAFYRTQFLGSYLNKTNLEQELQD